MKAVVDSIENEMATLLVGKDETTVVMPVKLLPPETREGSWLHIQITADPKHTQHMYQKNKALLEKIIRKNKK